MSKNTGNGIDQWQKARKKPVEVEFRGPYTDTDTIETIEGEFEIDEGYIEEHGGYVLIRGVDGEVYPCGLDIFRETYEQVFDEIPEYETRSAAEVLADLTGKPVEDFEPPEDIEYPDFDELESVVEDEECISES